MIYRPLRCLFSLRTPRFISICSQSRSPTDPNDLSLGKRSDTVLANPIQLASMPSAKPGAGDLRTGTGGQSGHLACGTCQVVGGPLSPTQSTQHPRALGYQPLPALLTQLMLSTRPEVTAVISHCVAPGERVWLGWLRSLMGYQCINPVAAKNTNNDEESSSWTMPSCWSFAVFGVVSESGSTGGCHGQGNEETLAASEKLSPLKPEP